MLYYGDQKICPVVKGEVPSSGYNFQLNLTGSGGSVSWVINDELTSSIAYGANLSNVVIRSKGNNTVRFGGDFSGGYNTGTIVINGVSQSIVPNITYTLASDDDYATVNLAQCLTGDTSITLANGGTKPIARLKVGDKILSVNPETGRLEEDEIIMSDATEEKYGKEYDIWNFEGCYQVKTVNRHRFYNVERQAFVYLDEWNIGEHTIVQEGKHVALLSHEVVKEKVRHFTLFTKTWNNYFANGLLSGNRDSVDLVTA